MFSALQSGGTGVAKRTDETTGGGDGNGEGEGEGEEKEEEEEGMGGRRRKWQ
jgi:hypothetical protein